MLVLVKIERKNSKLHLRSFSHLGVIFLSSLKKSTTKKISRFYLLAHKPSKLGSANAEMPIKSVFLVLPSGFEPELMVPKTIVLSITPREHIKFSEFLEWELSNPHTLSQKTIELSMVATRAWVYYTTQPFKRQMKFKYDIFSQTHCI